MLIDILLSIMIVFQIHGYPLSKDIPLKENKLDQNPDLFEGDIRFPVGNQPTSRGVLLRGDSVAWTNGIVPYEITAEYGPTQRSIIVSTMQKMERLIAINNVVCVQFRPRKPSDRYYITIRNGRGCSSYIGQNTGFDMERTVTLQHPGCVFQGTIMHELIHTLGFFHEHSRPDRDDYIRVNFENIQPGLSYAFDKYDNSFVDTLNTPYDYLSVMHYDRYTFSSNGYPTIDTLQPGVTIGNRDTMSTIDIEEIRLVYNCSSDGITFPLTVTTGNLYTVNTIVSSSLTINNCIYDRTGKLRQSYYYEAYKINLASDGYLLITSNSTIDTYGYLYAGTFFPNMPALNLITYDDDSIESQQFRLEVYLQSNITYTLVVTTYSELTIGDYQLIFSESNTTNIIISNDICKNTTPTSSPTTTTSLAPTTASDGITSTYSSALTIDSLTLNRTEGYDMYYYEPIIISASINGFYHIRSISNVDTHGYLYIDYFNPLNTTENLLISDDDSGNNSQFLISYSLESDARYILVVTTSYPNVTTPFTITALGPRRVYFNSINTTSTASASTGCNHILYSFIIYMVVIIKN